MNSLSINKANVELLPNIMQIVSEAQEYLASKGVDQWQNGYPTQAIILKDIKNGESYYITNGGTTVAITMFTTNPEPTYQNIEGQWLTPESSKYGVIHRMAVSNSIRKKGAARFIFAHFEEVLRQLQIKSMRIDTHEDNQDMQALLKKLGYSYCGIIYLENGDKRLAFEKMLLP